MHEPRLSRREFEPHYAQTWRLNRWFASIGCRWRLARSRRILYFLLLPVAACTVVPPKALAQTTTNFYPYIYSRWANPTGHYNVQITGCNLLCVSSVNNAQAVATTSLNDFAVASVTGISALGAQRKIAWADLEAMAPGGDYGGFVLGNLDLAQLSLFNSSSIRTYSNGVLRESRTISFLLDVVLLSGNRVAIAFKSTNAFNRVEVDLGGGLLDLSVFNNVTLHYAFAATIRSAKCE